MPRRRSALADAYKAGRMDAPAVHSGIVLSERTDLTLIDLRGDPADGGFAVTAQAALGCALPLAPNTSTRGPHCDILWLGPDEWLLISAQTGMISDELPIQPGCLTDVSHGRAALGISGPRSRELLAKGCGHDLHPLKFQAGQCAQTALAHIGVLLYLPRAGDGFEIYCARSYAQHLTHWLIAAAAGFS